MENEIEFFQRIPILNAFRSDALAELCRSVETMRLAPGETLFKKGDRSEGGYLVVSGVVELLGAGETDTRLFVYPGSLIGELSLIADIDRSADAVACERVEVRKILRAQVSRILQKDPLSATRIRAFLEAKSDELARSLQTFQAIAR